MPTTFRQRRYSPEQIAFFLFLIALTFGLYMRQVSRTLRADEIRVYRSKDFRTPSSRLLIKLKGNDAQNAADHFKVRSLGVCNYCLNPNLDSLVHIQFYNAGQLQKAVGLNLATGQIVELHNTECFENVTTNSHQYWANLISNRDK